ncbi:MAG: NADH-dependent flavin oxidoreductase [Armatimonadetes bacterium]|nr:NADH-dependent flavin oxidoreductase [Armatimonadota bacterium]
MPKLSFRDLPAQKILAPMTTYASLADGQISPDELPYLEARAKGGFDWIMTAACCVHPSGWSFAGQFQCWDDRFLESLTSVADAIHRGGSKAILQIHHGGRAAPSSLCGEVIKGFAGPVSASAIPAVRDGAETPRALSWDEIQELVQAYVQAAQRARTAGFDGVEIHGANTYLLQQFVSPHSNRRDDSYGQDRLRFSEEVTRGVVAAVGDELVVGYRFSPEELEEPGLRIGDTLSLLDRLLGLDLDFLHISLQKWNQSSLRNEYSEPTLEIVAKHIAGRMPLIGVGSVLTKEDFEGALTLGAHSVAVGRAAITNPDWVHKAFGGGQLRTKVPKMGAQETLVLPKGMADKIYAVPGWFPVED